MMIITSNINRLLLKEDKKPFSVYFALYLSRSSFSSSRIFHATRLLLKLSVYLSVFMPVAAVVWCTMYQPQTGARSFL